MPITRQQFELGINNEVAEWMERVHSFLAANKDKAYAPSEIYAHFKVKTFPPGSGLSGLIDAAIDKLLETYAIIGKEVRGRVYYCHNKELPKLQNL